MNDTWLKILEEVAKIEEEVMQGLVKQYVLSHQNLFEVMVSWLGIKLSDSQLPLSTILAHIEKIQPHAPDLSILLGKDLENYHKRDFACQSLTEALFFHRGFQALACFRLAHALWREKERSMSKWLANRTTELWGVDIHPAAIIGPGLVIDHCMGIVIGETSQIGQNVFLFHNVTLGGTGRTAGDRHPKIGSNVVIGTGATILGNIKVGDKAVIAAGALVLKEVPAGMMVAGTPARVKGKANAVQ